MGSVLLVLITIFLFGIAFKFYGKYLEKNFDVSEKNTTPCFLKRDNVDYVPCKHWLILFGHHFASIAGAGPILGPVVACVLFGWLPCFLWILIGSIFLGGVHDFSALMMSLRNEGNSVGDITSKEISETGKIVFSLFIWFSLILVVAVFAAVCSKTFVSNPHIVIPSFGIIFVAFLLGFLVYKLSINHFLSTVASLLILIILFQIGGKVPVNIRFMDPVKFWILILLLYSFFASILPVNILLQPRDYLSSYILYFGLLFGTIGIFTSSPDIKAPAFVSFSSNQGFLFPMMFVMIACGAISGFHSLVASGTTSKQITNEIDGKKIAYGGMLLEGILAVVALLSVSAGLLWTGFPSELNYPELMKKGDWIGTFSKGYSQITLKIFPENIGFLIASVMINGFVLTTLDTATRITRYITEEIFGKSFKISAFKNRYFSTLIVIFFAGYLAFGNWQKIWPVFGASNQLIAAIVLLVATIFLINKSKNFKITFFPSIFMFCVTMTALIYQAKNFYIKKNFLLGNISSILVFLSIFIIRETIRKYLRLKRSKA